MTHILGNDSGKAERPYRQAHPLDRSALDFLRVEENCQHKYQLMEMVVHIMGPYGNDHGEGGHRHCGYETLMQTNP